VSNSKEAVGVGGGRGLGFAVMQTTINYSIMMQTTINYSIMMQTTI
jgi:hypothetical protein